MWPQRRELSSQGQGQGCSLGGASVSGSTVMVELLGSQFSDQQEFGGAMTLATNTSANVGRAAM